MCLVMIWLGWYFSLCIFHQVRNCERLNSWAVARFAYEDVLSKFWHDKKKKKKIREDAQMTTSSKIPPLHKSLHSRLWSKMFPLKSNSCKKSRKAEHTNLSCKICFGSSTGILLFLRKKNQNLILKWRYLKAWHKRALFMGLVSSRDAGTLLLLQEPSRATLCVQRAPVTCINKHLSLPNATVDEIRELQKEF